MSTIPDSDKKRCDTCGKEFKQPGEKGLTYEMPSLFEPVQHACSKRCYNKWCAQRR